jgi:hypothetical protein
MENFNIGLALILFVIIVVVSMFFLLNKRRKTSSVIILDKIREINEFASHELNYFENVSYEEVLRLFNREIPFIRKGFSINILGKIRIGINMDHVEISVQNKNLYITMPEIRILSHETKTSEIGFQTKNPFFQNDFNDFNEKLEEKKRIKEKAILQDSGLLEKVYDDLKKKTTDSLLLIPGFGKKYKIHYITETPVLLIENPDNITPS